MASKPNVMQRAGELLERLQAMQVTPAAAVTSKGCDALLVTAEPSSEWKRCGLAVAVVSKQQTAAGIDFEISYCSCHRDRASKGSLFAKVVEVVEVRCEWHNRIDCKACYPDVEVQHG